MLPTQGPGVPVTSDTFSSRVNSDTKALALVRASSHAMPVVLGEGYTGGVEYMAESHAWPKPAKKSRSADLRELMKGNCRLS